jgi:hypothetical protein
METITRYVTRIKDTSDFWGWADANGLKVVKDLCKTDLYRDLTVWLEGSEFDYTNDVCYITVNFGREEDALYAEQTFN